MIPFPSHKLVGSRSLFSPTDGGKSDEEKAKLSLAQISDQEKSV